MGALLSEFGVSAQKRCLYSTRNAWYENGDVMAAFCQSYVNFVYVKVASTVVAAGDLTVRIWDTKKGPTANSPALTPVGGEDILLIESGPVSPGGLFEWRPPLSEKVGIVYETDGREMAKETLLGVLFEQGVRVQLWDEGANAAVDSSIRLTVLYYI